MRTALRIVALLALSASFYAHASQSAQPRTPSGTRSAIDLVVLDPAGGVIPKAEIIIVDSPGQRAAKGLTDERGRFSVSEVPPGDYKLTVRAYGFKEYDHALVVETEHAVAQISLNRTVDPNPDHLRHGDFAMEIVVQDANGAVISGANISVIQEETSVEFHGQSNERGAYAMSDLAAGAYSLRIESRGFKINNSRIRLRDHGTERVTIGLEVGPMSYVCSPCIGDLDLSPVHASVSSPGNELLPEPTLVAQPQAPTAVSKPNPFKRFFSALGHKLGF
jgi:hypothetical protein